MKITKLEHSGFLIEKGGRGIVIDPVEFTEKLPELTNLDAIVVTHKHSDHCQPEVLARLRAANPNVVIFTTSDNLEAAGGQLAESGASVQVGEFKLEFFSESHASIVPGVIPCENVGVVIDGVFAHLGDSLDYFGRPVSAVALANAAPWLKSCEAMEYIKQVEAQTIIPCHDAVLSDFGKTICNNCLGGACAESGKNLAKLRFGESIEL